MNAVVWLSPHGADMTQASSSCGGPFLSGNNWNRGPGVGVFKHAKFQTDAAFIFLIIKTINDQMQRSAHVCVCVSVCMWCLYNI